MAERQSSTLRFLTWNVNGLQNALRRQTTTLAQKRWAGQDQLNTEQVGKIKNIHVEMNKAHVVFLQETHIKIGQTDVFSDFSEWQKYYTEYGQAERGVAILIKKQIVFTEDKLFRDPLQSVFIVLHCSLNGQPYTLVNVYHHQDEEETLRTLSDYLQKYATGRLVIGGDFNTVFSPIMDKEVPTVNQHHSNMMKRLEPFMESLRLVDVWRWRYPYWCFYTYYRNRGSSRLDFFFVPEELLWCVQACEIEDVSTDDHLPVSLHLNNSSPLPPTDSQTRVDLFKYDSSNQVDVRDLGRQRQASANTTPHPRTPLEISFTGPVRRRFQQTIHVDTGVTTEKIEKAINCLQVSDTPRLDGIKASEYKECSDSGRLHGYLCQLCSRILGGSFDANREHFNDSVSVTADFHFFNVDYVILASVLALKLDEALKYLSDSHTKPDYETHVAVIYSFQEVPQSVDQSLLETALDSLSISRDVMAFCRILKKIPGSQKYQLCQGCPLTPSLHSLLLMYVAKKDLQRHDRIHVYKNSILSVQERNNVNINFHEMSSSEVSIKTNEMHVTKQIPISVLHAIRLSQESNDTPGPPLYPRPPLCRGPPWCLGPDQCRDPSFWPCP